MKVRLKLLAPLLFAALLPAYAQAATAYRLATIGEIQSAAANAGVHVTVIAQAGGWTGAAICPVEWAYFNSNENPHFMAEILAAKMADKQVRVYVDDSLPKYNGFCRITFLAIP